MALRIVRGALDARGRRLTIGRPARLSFEGSSTIMDNPKVADPWAGEGQLVLPAADGEEICDLAPVRVDAGYRVSMSYTATDLKTLTDRTESE